MDRIDYFIEAYIRSKTEILTNVIYLFKIHAMAYIFRGGT